MSLNFITVCPLFFQSFAAAELKGLLWLKAAGIFSLFWLHNGHKQQEVQDYLKNINI
jgi:hypothetical protein